MPPSRRCRRTARASSSSLSAPVRPRVSGCAASTRSTRGRSTTRRSEPIRCRRACRSGLQTRGRLASSRTESSNASTSTADPLKRFATPRSRVARRGARTARLSLPRRLTRGCVRWRRLAEYRFRSRRPMPSVARSHTRIQPSCRTGAIFSSGSRPRSRRSDWGRLIPRRPHTSSSPIRVRCMAPATYSLSARARCSPSRSMRTVSRSAASACSSPTTCARSH